MSYQEKTWQAIVTMTAGLGLLFLVGVSLIIIMAVIVYYGLMFPGILLLSVWFVVAIYLAGLAVTK